MGTQRIIILSNGQAAVERGFPTNKETLGVNMSKNTLVAYRLVHLLFIYFYIV